MRNGQDGGRLAVAGLQAERRDREQAPSGCVQRRDLLPGRWFSAANNGAAHEPRRDPGSRCDNGIHTIAKNKVVCICFGWRTRAVETGAVWDGRGGDNFCGVGCDDEFARWTGRSPWSPMDGFTCLAAGRRVCDEGKELLRVPSLRDRDRCEPVGPASPKEPQAAPSSLKQA
jgi:hypothetical protein